MKKALVPVLAVVLVLSMGTVVFAGGMGGGMNGGHGGMGGTNPNYNNNPNHGYIYLDPASAAKCLAFERAVLADKKRLLDLKIEMLTLQSQATPDVNAINAKFVEINNVRNNIIQTAVNQAVLGLCGGMGGRF